MYIRTTGTDKILQLKKRIRGVSGGTGASKTISILLFLIQYAQTGRNEVLSVVSESLPHLKRGAIRDFISIMKLHNYFREENWNRTDFIYTFSTGSIIEFFSVDQWERVKGARRDVLFINEANNVSYETYTQLEIRTKKIVWLDWNPVQEFWWYDEVLPNNDVDFITLTYKDNEELEQSIVSTIESRRLNKNWWRIYGMGQLGEAEGRIYTGWRIIKGIPKDAKIIRYGLDFGYTNDPTAIVAVYKFNDWLILDEITYQKGLSNKQIADILKYHQPALTRADSSEPKSIDEIRGYGITILPSSKGLGSVLAGIQYVQDQKIAITEQSVNGIKEYRNYLWMTDREGRIINEPSPIWNHFLDGVRYALDDMRLHRNIEGGAVKVQSVNKYPAKAWQQTPQGTIKGVDFWQAFKDEQQRRHSTSGIEFKNK